MAADRRRGFEAWARTNGDAAVRPNDRRGIAEDIFDLAGASDVDAAHIEEVSKRYRERLAGAQKILLARQIGDEILRWQRAPHKSVAPRNADSRREDDEIIGIQLDSMSLSVADVARAVAEKRAAEQEVGDAREVGRSEPPPSGAGARAATGSRPASPAQWSAHAPRTQGSTPSSPPGAPGSTPPSPPSERPRSEGAVDWAAPPRSSSSPRADAEEPGLWAPRRSPSTPAPKDDQPSLPPLGLPPPGPPPVSAPPLVPPPAPASPSAAPSAASPPSHPPSRRPRAPDAPTTTFELEGDSLRAVPPAAPAPAAPRDPAVPASPGFAVPRASSSSRMTRQAMIAGAALAVLIAVVVAWRTVVALRDRPVEVSGHTVSEHLRVSMQFAEPWVHERRKDDDGEQLGYRRAASTFYQGVTSEDFIMQLTVVTLEPDGHPAVADDVRKIGGHQRLTPVTEQVCRTVEGANETYRCTAKTLVKQRTFAVLEQYFLSGPRVVYVRALVEALADAPAALPKKGDVATTAATPPRLIAVVDEAKIQAIIESIQPL